MTPLTFALCGGAVRLCDPNDPQFDETDRENGLAGVDFAETLEYLVLWLSVTNLADYGLDDAAVDAALDAWEAENARLRTEAMRAARAERQ